MAKKAQRQKRALVAMIGALFMKEKLLSMLLQVLFYGRYLIGVRRTKSPVLIDIDQTGVLKTKNHIWLVIPIHIHEREHDRDQIRAGVIELRPEIDAGLRDRKSVV